MRNALPLPAAATRLQVFPFRNWNTGVLWFQPLFVQLFGASVMAQPGAPWLVSVSIPLGAIVFLVRASKREAGLDSAAGRASVS